MIIHCEKHADGYFYCHEMRALGRDEDCELERELERELLRIFPEERRAERLVREGEK